MLTKKQHTYACLISLAFFWALSGWILHVSTYNEGAGWKLYLVMNSVPTIMILVQWWRGMTERY